ncbi:hypothetical protein B0H13DRAFT_2271235 [Mycena leptocephala]|nr:hypothetical protein B0H13DRAFT_2271235 [Mycena leptocephala]
MAPFLSRCALDARAHWHDQGVKRQRTRQTQARRIQWTTQVCAPCIAPRVAPVTAGEVVRPSALLFIFSTSGRGTWVHQCSGMDSVSGNSDPACVRSGYSEARTAAALPASSAGWWCWRRCGALWGESGQLTAGRYRSARDVESLEWSSADTMSNSTPGAGGCDRCNTRKRSGPPVAVRVEYGAHQATGIDRVWLGLCTISLDAHGGPGEGSGRVHVWVGCTLLVAGDALQVHYLQEEHLRLLLDESVPNYVCPQLGKLRVRQFLFLFFPFFFCTATL